MKKVLYIRAFTVPRPELNLLVTVETDMYFTVEGDEADILTYMDDVNGLDGNLEEYKYIQSLAIVMKYEAENDLIHYYTLPQYEQDTFRIQEQEANAYSNDSSAETVLIDAMLQYNGRSKQVFIGDILFRSSQYNTEMGSLLGKKQKYIDQIMTSVSKEEILTIEWEE